MMAFDKVFQDLVLRDVTRLSDCKELGRGAYGKVYKVKYCGKIFAAKEIHPLLLEAVGEAQTQQTVESFLRECHQCSKLRHPNVVQFLGVYYPATTAGAQQNLRGRGMQLRLPIMVMEMMENSLASQLDRKQKKIPIWFKYSIVHDVSLGLHYLHSRDPPLVHRDLSSNNVLLTKYFEAKISDLGVAKALTPEKPRLYTQGPGTIDFMPPECLSSQKTVYGLPMDVYSFAGIVLHTFSEEWPTPLDKHFYNEETRSSCVRSESERRQHHLDKMKNEAESLLPLVKSCLNYVPKDRPSIEIVSDRVGQCKDAYMKKVTSPQFKEIIRDEEIQRLQTGNERLQAEVEHLKKSEKLRCCGPTDSRVIAPGKSGIASEDPITVPQFFKQACEKFPNVKAICWKGSKGRKDMFLRYADYKKLVYDVAKSFHKLGLESHHGVGILGFNSVEWFASSLGAVFAGGLSTGMYTTSSPETCHYILENCKANIVVVENKEQLDKILEIRHMLTHLKAIIQYKGELSKRYPKTYTWKEFLEVGKDTEDSVIDDIIDKQQPNQCAVLVYTSGTTGNPKGVMLSHDNLTWITKALMDTQQEPKLTCGGQERSVSYLPLAHIAGMIADIYLPILIGSTVYIAQPDALKEKDSLRHTMKEAIPTFFLGVPRLWERMKEMIDEHVANSNNAIVKYFFRWGTKENHSQSGWKYAVAKITVFKQFQKKAGLHMCKHIFVGSAPMHQATFEFFKSLNISISELYGLTECSGLHSIKFKSATQSKPKSCGKQLNGVETNIIECGVDEHNRGEGQVLIRGRHVFIGYLGMEKETREAIDDDGWLHSGDIGYRDDDNFLYITGRIKELISFPIINPNPIEDRIKTEIPFLSNVVVIGDNREFLTCLLTLKCTTNNNGEATDDLQSKVIKMFKKKLGSHCEKASEVYDTKDKAVFQAIGEGIRRYNMASRAHQVIRKFQLLRTDFTTRGGELGPTLKIQRQAIQKKYEKLINAMYT